MNEQIDLFSAAVYVERAAGLAVCGEHAVEIRDESEIDEWRDKAIDSATYPETTITTRNGKKVSDKLLLFPGVDPTLEAHSKGYRPNYRKGGTQTVYPIKKWDELERVALWLYENKDRKYLLGFILGINLGLRANELLKLRMLDVYLPDGMIRYVEDTQDTNDRINISQSKTHGKIRTVYLNTACASALHWYFGDHPYGLDKNKLIFSSREGGAIEVDTFRKVLKEACEAVGIRQNIGTHTMRKTWGWWQYTTNTGKQYGDVTQLQRLYGHESPMTTLRYIGVMDEEDKALYHSMVLAVAGDVIAYRDGEYK